MVFYGLKVPGGVHIQVPQLDKVGLVGIDEFAECCKLILIISKARENKVV